MSLNSKDATSNPSQSSSAASAAVSGSAGAEHAPTAVAQKKVCFICGSYTSQTINIFEPRSGPNIIELINEKFKVPPQSEDKFLCYSCNNWLINWHSLQNNKGTTDDDSSSGGGDRSAASGVASGSSNNSSSSSSSHSHSSSHNNISHSKASGGVTTMLLPRPPPPYTPDPYFDGCIQTMELRHRLKQYLYKRPTPVVHVSHANGSPPANINTNQIVQDVSIEKISPIVRREQHPTTGATIPRALPNNTTTVGLPMLDHGLATPPPTPTTPTNPSPTAVTTATAAATRSKRNSPTIISPRRQRRLERSRQLHVQRQQLGQRPQAALNECDQCGRVLHVLVGHARTRAELFLSQRVVRMCAECRRCLHKFHFGSDAESQAARERVLGIEAELAQRSRDVQAIAMAARVEPALAYMQYLDPMAAGAAVKVPAQAEERAQINSGVVTPPDSPQRGGVTVNAQMVSRLRKLGTTIVRECNDDDDKKTDDRDAAAESSMAAKRFCVDDRSSTVSSTTSPLKPLPGATLTTSASRVCETLASLQDSAPLLFSTLSLPRTSSIAAYRNSRLMRTFRRAQQQQQQQQSGATMTPNSNAAAQDATTTMGNASQRLHGDRHAGRREIRSTRSGSIANHSTAPAHAGYERNEKNEIVLAFDRTLTEVFPVADRHWIASSADNAAGNGGDASLVTSTRSLDEDDDDEDETMHAGGDSSSMVVGIGNKEEEEEVIDEISSEFSVRIPKSLSITLLA